MHYHRLKIYAYLIAAPLLILTLNALWQQIKNKIVEYKQNKTKNSKQERTTKFFNSILNFKKHNKHKVVEIIKIFGARLKIKNAILYILLITTIAYLAFFGYSSSDMIKEKFTEPTINITGARIITVEEFKDPVYFNHNQRYELARNKNLVMKGLFVEASLDSPRIFALEQKLKEQGIIYAWGVESPLGDVLSNKTMLQPANFYLDLFGIQYIISSENITVITNNTYKINKYTITKIKDSANLVDVPKYNISFINIKKDSEWKIYLDEWYKKSRNIVIALDSQIKYNISQEYATTGTARLTKQEKNYNLLKIQVDSEEVVPIYIKFAYSNKWVAKTETGEILQIYRATPNNMVVFTNKDFILEYKGFNTTAALGLIITTISLIILIFYFENITRFARKHNII